MDVEAYWAAVLDQDAARIPTFFQPDAYVNWRNSNEQFTVPEFVRANCEYPGRWRGALQKTLEIGDQLVTVARVWAADGAPSFHVTSFFQLREGRIAALDEYWGDDGPAPQWRRDMHLGRPIP